MSSALGHLKILELAEGVAGEYCGKLLADLGAQVIKLERPGIGSPTRRLGPFVADGSEGERSGLFAYLNSNKASVELDVSSSASAETLRQLLDRVDAVIDDHAPGWLQAIGVDPQTCETQRPGLVLCSITPYGQGASEDRRHAEDLNLIHASGWGYHTPSGADERLPPLKGPGRFLPSYEAGLDAALCVSAALLEREHSRLGRVIDISTQAVLASRVDYVLGQMVAGDMEPSDRRNAFDLFGPAGIFACRDGYAFIWMSAPAHWEALRSLLGDPAWMREFPERWLERDCTPERVAQCRNHIAHWLETQDKDAVSAAAQKLGLTLVPVNDAQDLLRCPQYAHRGFFAELTHPVLGTRRYPTAPYRLSATPARLSTAAPRLGQHNTDACR